ncbi:MAG: SUMF1/EgtB/PvdO family nonheme iron enzyme [Planctomycetota bacterium]
MAAVFQGCNSRSTETRDDPLAYVSYIPADALGGTERISSKGFFLELTEVTNERFAEFIKETGYKSSNTLFLDHWKKLPNGDRVIPPGLESHPVVNVSAMDAEEFVKWRRMRLPTKSEWEAAAGFGVDGGYPFGIWQNLRANTLELGLGHTTPVGLFENGRSALQLYDLAGNAGELTIAPNGGCVVKGGSFLQNRLRVIPSDEEPVLSYQFSAPDVGFRCAADAVPFLLERVMRSGAGFDTKSRWLSGFLQRSGVTARAFLNIFKDEYPESRTLIMNAFAAPRAPK